MSSQMGCKFECQACGNEVVQGPFPELRFVDGVGMQCCVKCTQAIDKEQAKRVAKAEAKAAKAQKAKAPKQKEEDPRDKLIAELQAQVTALTERSNGGEEKQPKATTTAAGRRRPRSKAGS